MTEKWKRNKLFEAIQGVGLVPRDFDFLDGDVQVQLKHRWSESFFIIGGTSGKYDVSNVVGDGHLWSHTAYSWEGVLRSFDTWIREVKLDLQTPDLWSELQREAELLGGKFTDANANTPFTTEEQREIRERLQELAESARRTYSLTGQQMQILNAKVDYLIGAANRLGRIDWRNALAGAILGFILAAALPPESAHHMLLQLLRAIAHLYGQIGLLGG